MENRMVCECYGIRVDDIKAAIQNGDDSFEKLERKMRLGVMCGACVRDAKEVIEVLKAENRSR